MVQFFAAQCTIIIAIIIIIIIIIFSIRSCLRPSLNFITTVKIIATHHLLIVGASQL